MEGFFPFVFQFFFAVFYLSIYLSILVGDGGLSVECVAMVTDCKPLKIHPSVTGNFATLFPPHSPALSNTNPSHHIQRGETPFSPFEFFTSFLTNELAHIHNFFSLASHSFPFFFFFISNLYIYAFAKSLFIKEKKKSTYILNK